MLVKGALELTKLFISATLLAGSNKPELASLKLSELAHNMQVLHPLDGTHLDVVRGLIQTKRFRPSASTKRAQLSVAATTVRSTDLFNIMSSPESMLIRQD